MIHCAGQGYRIEYLDTRQALKKNDGKLYGRVSAGMLQEKPVAWNVTFTGGAFELVLDQEAGSLINIVHGVVETDGGGNADTDYNLVIDKAEVFTGARAPDYCRLTVTANGMTVLKKLDATDGQAWRIILSADEPGRPAGAEPNAVKWYTFFVNAAYGQAREIAVNDTIDIKAAEILHIFSNKNNCYQVYLTVLLFTKAARASGIDRGEPDPVATPSQVTKVIEGNQTGAVIPAADGKQIAARPSPPPLKPAGIQTEQIPERATGAQNGGIQAAETDKPAREPEKTTEPATVEPDVPKLSATEPDVSKPAEREPDVPKPATREPDVPKPSATEPDIAEPAVTEPDIATTREPGKPELAAQGPGIREQDAESPPPDTESAGALRMYDEPIKLYTLTTGKKATGTARVSEIRTERPQIITKPALEAYKPLGDMPKLYTVSAKGKTRTENEPANAPQPPALPQTFDDAVIGSQPLKLYKLAGKKGQTGSPDAPNKPIAQVTRIENAKLDETDGQGVPPAPKLYKITSKKAEGGTNGLTGKTNENYGQKYEINSSAMAVDIEEDHDTDDVDEPDYPESELKSLLALIKPKKRIPAPKKKGKNEATATEDHADGLEDDMVGPEAIGADAENGGARDDDGRDSGGPGRTGKIKTALATLKGKLRFPKRNRREPKPAKHKKAPVTEKKRVNILTGFFMPKPKEKTADNGEADKKAKKKKPPKNKYEKSLAKLEPKIKAIEGKRRENPYYVQTKKERAMMKRWQNLQLAKRKEDIRIGKRRISKKNAKMKRRRKATVIPRTTQLSIPYITDYEEGMFEVEANKYSKTYIMQDINYLVAQEDEQRNIFEKYGQFLNYFNDDTNIAITIDNHVVSMSEQERKIFYGDKGDDYDLHRHEYNAILRQQLMSGRNDIKITKYVTVTIDCDTPYEALLRFHKIDAEVITNLRRIGSDGKMLTTDERLAMLHDKFRKGHEGEFNVNFDFLKEQGLSSKDYIAPTSFRFERSHYMIDDEYYRCMFVSNLPNSLVDTFLSELVDVEFPLVTTINIQPLAQSKALRLIRKQLTGMESNKIESEKRALRSGYSPDMISHDLKQSLSQAEKLLDDVQNNDQKMFFVSITLMVCGATLDELDERCKILESRARQKTCQLQAFAYQQENAFKCTLPLGVPTYNKIYVERALTTQATAVFIPFSAQELFQIGGFYYGLNQMSRNLILCDRTSMKTPSGFILGSSGSGKSFATKREQLNVLLQSDKTSVIVIDPENEYGEFARAFGGTRVNISMESSNYVNPMDMSADYGLDDEDELDIEIRKTKALQKKSDIIMSIIQSMISVGKNSETIITPQQKTIVDRAVRRAYRNYLVHDFDPEYLPTLLDLQEELYKERGTTDGQLMADGVEYYTKGSMNVFSHKTNVNYTGRFVVFNVKDLGEQLKQIALLIILDFIWNRLMTNFTAGVRTYCYVDEIHVLFQNEYSSRFLQQLYKRGRKYGLVMTGITQNMTDVLATEMSRSMIANSDFLMLLNQSPEDLKILSEMLNISETQMSFVNRADAGCGLLFAEKVIVPFVDHFPQRSYLYKLMSTKFGEEYTTETVEDILSEAQQEKAAESRYSLHNSRVAERVV